VARHVFISYATTDHAFATTLCGVLEELGITCWMAPRDVVPGTPFDDAIIEAINTVGALVLILSRSSNESSFVKNEVSLAFSKRRPIFTVRTEEMAPERGLQLYLATHQWTDAFQPPIDGKLRELAAAIRIVLEGSIDPSTTSRDTTESRSWIGRQAFTDEQLTRIYYELRLAITDPSTFAEDLSKSVESSLDRSKDLSDCVSQVLARYAGDTVPSQTVAFFYRWVLATLPQQIMSRSFYVSERRIGKVFANYSPHFDREIGGGRRTLPQDSSQRLYAVHKHLQTRRQLYFLPAMELLGEPGPPRDGLSYFVFKFRLLWDQVLETDFPTHGSDNPTTLANRIFDHPDPYYCPFVTFVTEAWKQTLTLRLSRKHIRVDTGTIGSLAKLCQSSGAPLAGLAEIETEQDGAIVLHALTCEIASASEWGI
jgi:hypothetical protein